MIAVIPALTVRSAWKALEAQHRKIRDLHLRELFANDPELGKVLAQRIIPELESEAEPALGHDKSTNNLIRSYRRRKGRS